MNLDGKGIGSIGISTEMSFANKRLLNTGSTGSFGKAVLKRFLDTDIAEYS